MIEDSNPSHGCSSLYLLVLTFTCSFECFSAETIPYFYSNLPQSAEFSAILDRQVHMGGFERIVIHHSRKRPTPLYMDRQADNVLKTKAKSFYNSIYLSARRKYFSQKGIFLLGDLEIKVIWGNIICIRFYKTEFEQFLCTIFLSE